VYQCLFINTVNNTYLGNTDTYLSLDLFLFLLFAACLQILFFPPSSFLFQLKILEVGGGSGANFKYFKVPAIVDIVGKVVAFLSHNLINAVIVFRTIKRNPFQSRG
jgi:hypothetical protein